MISAGVSRGLHASQLRVGRSDLNIALNRGGVGDRQLRVPSGVHANEAIVAVGRVTFMRCDCRRDDEPLVKNGLCGMYASYSRAGACRASVAAAAINSPGSIGFAKWIWKPLRRARVAVFGPRECRQRRRGDVAVLRCASD